MHIHELLMHAVKQKASDLHLSAGEIPMIRVHGEIQRLNAPPLTSDEAKRLVYSVMNEKQKTLFEHSLELDFSIGLKGLARFRVNAFNHTRGVGAVFRLIPFELMSLKDLGLPPIVADFARYRKGLVLVTGPTGSGKSTTLGAIIDLINQTRSDHIITIEDPVEFYHKPKRSLINQREVGTHTHSFSAALRSALREDPDVVLIGELRDLETISLAMTAAETGHLVFATLHTNDAVSAITRLLDMGVEPFLISSALRCVVSQRLVRSICTRCKEPIRVDTELLALVPSNLRTIEKTYRGKGCIHCFNTGYRGRTVIAEVLDVTEAVRRKLVERASSQELTRVAIDEGMRPLFQDGMTKVAEGITSLEEVLTVCDDLTI